MCQFAFCGKFRNLISKTNYFYQKFVFSFTILLFENQLTISTQKFAPFHYRFIVYSAKVLVPAKLSPEPSSTLSKKRKHDDSVDDPLFCVPSQPHGLAYWIDAYTDLSFAVATHDISSTINTSCFRWCEDLSSEHQHVMVVSENPKQMEKTIKSFIKHESKVLQEVRARMFIPHSPLGTFMAQMLRLGAVDVTRRGDVFENFIRSDGLGLEANSIERLDCVWEIEKACRIRRLELSTLTEDQRRILGKIESLQARDSPFKSTLEAYIDILASGFGSIHQTDHSAFLEVRCGLRNAQCTCWECYEDSFDTCNLSTTVDDVTDKETIFTKQTLSTD